MPACPYWVLGLGESNESVRIRMDGHSLPALKKNKILRALVHALSSWSYAQASWLEALAAID